MTYLSRQPVARLLANVRFAEWLHAELATLCPSEENELWREQTAEVVAQHRAELARRAEIAGRVAAEWRERVG